MLDVVIVVAPLPSFRVMYCCDALNAHPDFSPLKTEPSVYMIVSSGLQFSSIRLCICLSVAPSGHSLHSLPRVAITLVYLTFISSPTLTHASPRLIASTVRPHSSIVSTA